MLPCVTSKSNGERLMARRPLVALVDDDDSVRESLPDLLRELGYTVSAFASAEDFLASNSLPTTRCLILDVAMPGLSGPDLHLELISRGHSIPTIFITARTDESLRHKLLRQGAVACLFKPFSDPALRAALDAALPTSRR
jgi:FixJ family two-component response regulator